MYVATANGVDEFDVATRQRLRTFLIPRQTHFLAITPDGRRLVVTSHTPAEARVIDVTSRPTSCAT